MSTELIPEHTADIRKGLVRSLADVGHSMESLGSWIADVPSAAEVGPQVGFAALAGSEAE